MIKNYLKNKHCECGKLIDNRSLRCKRCSINFYKGINSPNLKNGKTFGNKCIICGEHITYEAVRCMSCASKERIKNIDFTRNTNPNYKKGKWSDKLNKCSDCGKIIDPRAIRCVECYQKYNVGEHNPAYIHGEGNAPYPNKFNDNLKEFIRKRDNYSCQNCNMTEEEHIIVLGQNLHVHHIDYNKQNCKKENLITLCHQCNLRANYNRDYWYNFYINKRREELSPTCNAKDETGKSEN